MGSVKLEQAKAGRNHVAIQSFEGNIRGLNQKIAFCAELRKFSAGNNIAFDFVVLRTDVFNSNFSKEYLKRTLIVFNDGEDRVFPMAEVCPTLNASVEDGKMFYIFHRKNGEERLCNVSVFCEELFLNTAKIR